MTEENKNENQPQFELKHLYTKDVSFEVPFAPEVFQQKWEPKVSIDLETQNKNLNGGEAYNVDLSVTVTVKNQDKEAYIAEVKQAGIFLIKNFEKEQLEHFVHVYCPNLLFPYVREAISTLVLKGGFAPFLLAPINFESLYQERKAKAKS